MCPKNQVGEVFVGYVYGQINPDLDATVSLYKNNYKPKAYVRPVRNMYQNLQDGEMKL